VETLCLLAQELGFDFDHTGIRMRIERLLSLLTAQIAVLKARA